MPVSGTIIPEPKKRLMVVVREVAMPEESAVTIWEVPWLCGSVESNETLETCNSLFKTFESIRVIVGYIQCMLIGDPSTRSMRICLVENTSFVKIHVFHIVGIT